MKEWEEELYMYRLSLAPPKVKDLQEYIDLYLSEKDEKYFEWFLHYYEPILNTTAMGIVQRYAMQGHFEDIKEVCILGLLQALDKYPAGCGTPFLTYKTRIMWDEVHRYIRTMRTGLTVPSDSEYKKVRKAMRIYNACKQQNKPDALMKISKAIGVKEDIASQILQGAVRNQQFIDFYRQYADEDSEESHEEVYGDGRLELLQTLIQKEQREALFSAYDSLDFKEQEVIRIFYKPGVKANVIFYDKKPASPEIQTKDIWIYDFRTNIHFTLKQHPMTDADLLDFIQCYHPENRHERTETWSEENPDGRWRKFSVEEILKRDKTSLDIFWIKDKSLADLDSLPDPDVLAADIIENLQSAMDSFNELMLTLNEHKN